MSISWQEELHLWGGLQSPKKSCVMILKGTLINWLVSTTTTTYNTTN
jgi:hypothetical protein